MCFSYLLKLPFWSKGILTCMLIAFFIAIYGTRQVLNLIMRLSREIDGVSVHRQCNIVALKTTCSWTHSLSALNRVGAWRVWQNNNNNKKKTDTDRLISHKKMFYTMCVHQSGQPSHLCGLLKASAEMLEIWQQRLYWPAWTNVQANQRFLLETTLSQVIKCIYISYSWYELMTKQV